MSSNKKKPAQNKKGASSGQSQARNTTGQTTRLAESVSVPDEIGQTTRLVAPARGPVEKSPVDSPVQQGLSHKVDGNITYSAAVGCTTRPDPPVSGHNGQVTPGTTRIPTSSVVFTAPLSLRKLTKLQWSNMVREARTFLGNLVAPRCILACTTSSLLQRRSDSIGC